MENNSNNIKNWEIHKESPTGRILGGIIVISVGIIFLLKAMGVVFPSWLFTWQMLIIVIGLFSGAKKGFNGFGWLIPVSIGTFFLLTEFYGWPIKHFFWPVFLIIIGSIMILKPKRKRRYTHNITETYQQCENPAPVNFSSEDTIEVNCIFGGSRRAVITKNFKGGEVNAIFGGAEVNLGQADFEGKATLEVNAIFGGVKLIVPSHWKVVSESTVILGGVDDKRINDTISTDNSKTLVLKGVAAFGGIEIKNY